MIQTRPVSDLRNKFLDIEKIVNGGACISYQKWIGCNGETQSRYVFKSFVWAVQWHPEFSYQTDGNGRRIFQVFVRVCREKR